jgi:hypothetical protein
MNRMYSSGYGRFQTADLLAGSPSDPQSLNRFAYVQNDPMNFIDPFGLAQFCVNSGTGDNCVNEPDIPTEIIDLIFGRIGLGSGNVGGGSTPNPPATDKNGCLLPGFAGPPTPQCQAKSPVANLIAAQSAAYRRCVTSGMFKFDPEEIKIEKTEPPEGQNADMGVIPGEGLSPLPSNNEMSIETMKGCLKQFPLAALDTTFEGLSPGSVF